MIKAIYFDWGHTFATFFPNREQKINKILKPFGFNWQNFHHFWRKFYILRSAGKINSDSEFETFIQRTTKKKILVKEIIKITVESHLIPKEHIEIVKKLKKKYKVGILSNQVEGWVKQVLKNYKIEKLFDSLTISSAVGERKPNAKIYYEALKALSAKPEESVFVADEVAEDLVAASGLGMKTIWFNTNAKGWWKGDDKDVLKIYKPDAVVKNLKEVLDIIEGW